MVKETMRGASTYTYDLQPYFSNPNDLIILNRMRNKTILFHRSSISNYRSGSCIH